MFVLKSSKPIGIKYVRAPPDFIKYSICMIVIYWVYIEGFPSNFMIKVVSQKEEITITLLGKRQEAEERNISEHLGA